MRRLRPFFSYFGSKWGLARHYPAPRHDLVIEPFAGSAGYALLHHERQVLLVEKSPSVAAVWRYLLRASSSEVMKLPLDPSKRFDLPDGARELVGFWCGRGRVVPATYESPWFGDSRWPTSFWGEYARRRIAEQVDAIRHWSLVEGDYEDSSPDVEATWFVDPPYVASRHYPTRVRREDYEKLGLWCMRRRGLVVVCENEGATWLPFRPFKDGRTMQRGTSREAVWVRDDSDARRTA